MYCLLHSALHAEFAANSATNPASRPISLGRPLQILEYQKYVHPVASCLVRLSINSVPSILHTTLQHGAPLRRSACALGVASRRSQQRLGENTADGMGKPSKLQNRPRAVLTYSRTTGTPSPATSPRTSSSTPPNASSTTASGTSATATSSSTTAGHAAAATTATSSSTRRSFPMGCWPCRTNCTTRICCSACTPAPGR